MTHASSDGAVRRPLQAKTGSSAEFLNVVDLHDTVMAERLMEEPSWLRVVRGELVFVGRVALRPGSRALIGLDSGDSRHVSNDERPDVLMIC